MKSGELARLAGVTVRTLRHYRKIGLMDEPVRADNGYCDYSVGDLIRLLRIRNLAALGLSLDNIAVALDELDVSGGLAAASNASRGTAASSDGGGDSDSDSGGHTNNYLDELDAELAARIAQLESQRELIAKMKQDQIAGDVGPELNRVMSLLASSELTPQQVKTERDGLTLVNHLVDDAGKARLSELEQRMVLPSVTQQLQDIGGRFHDLREDASPEEKQELAQNLTALVEAVQEHSSDAESQDLSQYQELLYGYFTENLNTAQLEVMRAVQARFSQ